MYRNVKILTLFNFFTDFKLYAPVAIIYFADVSGSFALGMSIFAITMVSSALFEIPTGIFSDRIGRKKTVVIGALCALFYSIFYALITVELMDLTDSEIEELMHLVRTAAPGAGGSTGTRVLQGA